MAAVVGDVGGEVGVGAGQQAGDGGVQGRLVALNDEQVVGVLVFGEVAGGLDLGVQGVQGHDLPGQVKVGDGGRQFGNLVGLGRNLALRESGAGRGVHDR